MPRLALPLAIAMIVTMTSQPTAAENADGPFAIALHGGAGSLPADITDKQRRAYTDSLQAALDLGVKLLDGGAPALDVVEQVIRHLEDDPLFNAGKGAVLNSAGGHELDASIMDGRDRSCGAVAGVTTVKNPISLARLVMTKTRHVLLASEGADKFAVEMNVERVDQKYFWTKARYEQWQKVHRENEQKRGKSNEGAKANELSPGYELGTVGCVVLDRAGNLAAGTSTGGLTDKKFGRVGDSPIVGAGTYADNRTCATSGTGIGEHFIRNAVAYDVSALMEYKGLSVNAAVEHVIRKKLDKGVGGLIAVGRDGSVAIDFNTPGMFRAWRDAKGASGVAAGK